MKSISKKVIECNGKISRKPRDIKKLLNYNILNLLNKTGRSDYLNLPILYCDTDVFPDFLALYKELGLYEHYENTGVCFYSYDIEFDNKDGLFNAIYYDNKKRLDYYKERFRNVRFFIGPDYSTFGDIHIIENYYRIFKARIVCLWLTFELNAVVIPNVSYSSIKELPIYFAGLEQCKVIAMSTKSHVRYPKERKLFMNVIKYAVDNLPLKSIVIYSSCGKDKNCLDLFKYASDKGIQLIIPENTLRIRNRKEVING